MAEADLTVLVADDEDILRALLVRILERAGCRVLAARDGAEALARFRESPAPVDVAVLDLHMPPAGAVALLRELLAERTELGVILTSGAGPDADVRSTLEACGGTFVHKPFAPEALLAALEKVRPAA